MNTAERYLIWLLAAALVTAAVAWIAFQLQQNGVAPAILFPLLVGGALAVALASIGRVVRVPSRRAAAAAAVCWGLLAVLGQDYIGHRYRLRQYDDELGRNPLATALARESELRPTFSDHLRAKLRVRPVWWTLDLVLTAAAAGFVVGAAANTRFPAREQGEGD